MPVWDKIKNFKGLMDLSSLGIANVVGSGISAVFWFYLASITETEVYGEISYLMAIGGIASVISLLGSSTTVTIYTAKNVNIVPVVAVISLSSSVVAAITLLLLFENPALGIYAVGYVIFNLGIGELIGRKLFKNYTKYFISQKIVMVGLAIPLFYTIGVNGVVLGFGLSFLVFLPRIYNEFRSSKLEFSVLRPRLGFMMNSYVLDLARAFSGQTDKLIIAPIFGLSLLGNYYLGLQVLSVLSILPSVVFQYILPHDASGKPNKLLKKLTVLFSIILAIVGIFLSPLIIPNLFPKYQDAVIIIQIISITIIPRTISTMLTSKFLGEEKSRFVVIGTLIFLVIQIPSLIFLGDIYGPSGIASSLVLAAVSESAYLVTMSRFVKGGNQKPTKDNKIR